MWVREFSTNTLNGHSSFIFLSLRDWGGGSGGGWRVKGWHLENRPHYLHFKNGNQTHISFINYNFVITDRSILLSMFWRRYDKMWLLWCRNMLIKTVSIFCNVGCPLLAVQSPERLSSQVKTWEAAPQNGQDPSRNRKEATACYQIESTSSSPDTRNASL